MLSLFGLGCWIIWIVLWIKTSIINSDELMWWLNIDMEGCRNGKIEYVWEN